MTPLSRPSRTLRRVGAAALLVLVLSSATAAFAAESGTQTTAPSPAPTYCSNCADLTAGSAAWSHTRNSVIQANVTAKVGVNNSQGVPAAGWPADIYRRDTMTRESLDWTEGVINTAPSTAFNFTGKYVSMPSVSQSAGVVTSSGTWEGGSVSALATYQALGEAPVVKVQVTFTNTGATTVDQSFAYVIDPDETNLGTQAQAQVAIVPGLGTNTNALRTSGWTSNYTYQGPGTNAIASPGHGIAWLTDQPEAINSQQNGSGAYTSVWWPLELAPGASDTITFYHIVAPPSAGSNVAAGIAQYAAQLATLDDGSSSVPASVHGRVSGPAGEDVSGVTIRARRVDATLVGTAITGADGTFSMALPAGTYTLTASRLGYTNDSRSVEATSGDGFQLDFEVFPVQASADTNRQLPGSLVEGGASEIVMENANLAMAIATVFNDPQLPGSTKGKPLDMAAAGLNDGVDWFNLPYLSSTIPPLVTDAWQQTQVITDTVDIIDPGPDQAVVRATGHWATDPNVGIVTTYTIEPGQPWVTASTTYTNSGGSVVTAYTGDVIDVDDGTTISYVAGNTEVTASSPSALTPTAPWIAQTGAQGQVFGLVYTDAFDFQAYATAAWVMSVGNVSIPAGGSTTFTRRIVVAPTTDPGDRSGPVRQVWEQHLSDLEGVTADMTVDHSEVNSGAVVTAHVTVTNVGDEPVSESSLSFDPGTLTPLDPLTVAVPPLAPGASTSFTFRARAVQGGSTTVTSRLDSGGFTVSTRTEKVFVNGPGWYRGDNHTHSTYSDGSGTIAQNMASARAQGLSFVTATDHNTISQRDVLAPEQRADFVAMYGEEVTAGYGHSLAYNITSLVSPGSVPQTMLNNVNANNGGKGFLYIAHPYYPGLEWDDSNGIAGLRGIEVWNGFYPPKHTVNAQAFAKWDELNRAGRHLLGLANSDAHNPGKVGSPSVRAYLDELAPSEIIEALGSGYLYGTDGLAMHFSVNGVHMGGDVVVPAAGGPVSIDLGADYGPGITQVRLLVDGTVTQTWNPNAASFDQVASVTLQPGQFVRLEADGAGGRFAFSNPVWATDQGVATVDAPQLDRIVGATSDQVRLDWTGVSGATGYAVDEAPLPTTPVQPPTMSSGWSPIAGGFSADPPASTTATLAFDVTGQSVLRFDETLDTEPNIDWATVTAVLGDGSRVTLRRVSASSGGLRSVALALPPGTVTVELALAVDGNDGGRDYAGWQVTNLAVGIPTFSQVGTSGDPFAELAGRPAGQHIYRVRALLPGGGEAGSNLEIATVDELPGAVVPEAPMVVLIALSALGVFGLAWRRKQRLATP